MYMCGISVEVCVVVPLRLVLSLLLRRHGAASQPALPQVGGGVPEGVHHPRLLIVDEDLTVLEAHTTVVRQSTSHTDTHTQQSNQFRLRPSVPSYKHISTNLTHLFVKSLFRY